MNPTSAEVRLVDAQQQRRLGPDRPLVVGGAGAVRRPDLDEPRARAGEHVRDPEAVADLDQLAARDEHLAPLGQRGEREQHRGGVVVDDERRLGAGQPAKQRREVVLARAARAGREVVLEVRVAGRGSRTRSSAASASGARPRFVCTSTPVALRTRRSARPPRRSRAPRQRARARSPGSAPARISSRARSSTGARGLDGERIVERSSAASSSTDGRSRSLTPMSVERRGCGYFES